MEDREAETGGALLSEVTDVIVLPISPDDAFHLLLPSRLLCPSDDCLLPSLCLLPPVLGGTEGGIDGVALRSTLSSSDVVRLCAALSAVTSFSTLAVVRRKDVISRITSSFNLVPSLKKPLHSRQSSVKSDRVRLSFSSASIWF